MSALAIDVKGGYVEASLMASILRVSCADTGVGYLVSENSTERDGEGTTGGSTRKERPCRCQQTSHQRYMDMIRLVGEKRPMTRTVADGTQ
jgi:hypothetical protein